MFENLFIPVGTRLHLTAATITPEQITVDLAATSPAMPCPRCQVSATRMHSRYQRTLADLAILQRPVCLLLHVRRFFCDNATCSQRTFCERLPDLVAVCARRTTRLRSEQRRLGLDIGGEAGARLAHRQGMPVSPATLLRLARRDPPPRTAARFRWRRPAHPPCGWKPSDRTTRPVRSPDRHWRNRRAGCGRKSNG